jgi:hypothetical protein
MWARAHEHVLFCFNVLHVLFCFNVPYVLLCFNHWMKGGVLGWLQSV